MTTGAAVAMAGHFSKGNQSGKETIDRISGSGVFAGDPDSLLMFTQHEEDGALTVEAVLRNFPPVKPFVVQWEWPRFYREDSLDPAKLKKAGGRPPKHTSETLLQCLGNQRLQTKEWRTLAREELGIPKTAFFGLVSVLEDEGKIQKSSVDEKWEQVRKQSGNSDNEKHQ